MMKSVSVSAVLALAFAGAAWATPPEATDVVADDGFNLTIPGDDLETSEDGWNLGISDDVTEDGFVIPDGVVEDRLGDVAEIPTVDAVPEVSAELPTISAPEDDLIRIE